MGLASGARGTEACWRANVAPAQEQQKSWSHNKTAGCIDGQISMFPNAFGNSWTRKIKCDEPSEIGLKSSANRAEEALKNAEEADRFG